MAYLYKVLSGTVYHQGLHLDISTLISPEEDPLLEPMIAAGMVGREDIRAFSALASGSIGAYTGIYLVSAGVVSQMTEANVNGCIGITIEAAANGHEVRYIKGGPAIGMLLGDASIADGTSVIAGTNGKAVAFQLAQSKLLDGGTGLGTSQDDITQTPWAGTGGDYVYAHTSVDNASEQRQDRNDILHRSGNWFYRERKLNSKPRGFFRPDSKHIQGFQRSWLLSQSDIQWYVGH